MRSKLSAVSTLERAQSTQLWKPHACQEKGKAWLLKHEGAGLFFTPGLGKTVVTLSAYIELKRKTPGLKLLVIAPLQVTLNVWGQEVAKWAHTSHLKVAILHGPKKAKLLNSGADVYVINPEGMGWLSTQWRVSGLTGCMLVVDECQRFKNFTSQRFKTLKALLPKFSRRVILTGSPASNGLLDTFAPMYIADLGKAFGPFITHFRNKYFFSSGYGGYGWTPYPGAAQEIHAKLKQVALALEARDYIDMPSQINNTVPVTLDAKGQQAYDEMEKELITTAGTETIVAVVSSSASIKCRQILGGALYTQDAYGNSTTKHVEVHDVKIQAVIDLVDQLEGPVLIAYEFQHEEQRLLKAFGDRAVSFRRAKPVVFEAWNRGEIRVALGQPESMGFGLNLQGSGNQIVWFTLPWKRDNYDQLNARLLRQGSAHSHVFVHHIVAAGTLDEVVVKVLVSKGKVEASLYDSLKPKK